MSDRPASADTLDAAVRLQERFEFYVVALTFTILGLSVQTAHLGQSTVADVLEVAGWLALLASGLAGLSRLQGLSRITELIAWRLRTEEEEAALKKAKPGGTTTAHVLQQSRDMPIDDLVAAAVTSTAKLKERITELEASHARKYRLQRRAFVGGLVLLLASRAYLPIVAAVCQIARWLPAFRSS